jgi:hypothetical protein
MTMGRKKVMTRGRRSKIKKFVERLETYIIFKPRQLPLSPQNSESHGGAENTRALSGSTFFTYMTIVPKVLLPTINYSTNNHNDTIKLRRGIQSIFFGCSDIPVFKHAELNTKKR